MAAPGSVRIEVLSPERYAQDFAVMQEFLSGKHLCCMCPLSCLSSEADHRREHQGWPADKQSLGAVAVGVDGEIIGIVQMALHGHPATLHSVKPGECYIELRAITAVSQRCDSRRIALLCNQTKPSVRASAQCPDLKKISTGAEQQIATRSP